MKAGKVWGSTQLLLNKNNVEMHRIEIKDNGYCSKHKHEHKWNLFYVESGELEITVWKKSYDLCDVTVLRPGEMTAVGPGEFHQFHALSDVVAYEIYWVDLDTSDIVRESVGGADLAIIKEEVARAVD